MIYPTTGSSNGTAFGSRSLAECRRLYLEHRSMRGATRQSQYAMERYTADFMHWCEAGALTDVDQVTADVITRYVRWLHSYRQQNGRPLSTNSVLSKLVPLRGWFRWLARTRRLQADPTVEMELPAREWTLPRDIPTVTEVESILTQPVLSRPTGLRDRALLELLFATGIRRMEAAGASLCDVDLVRQSFFVRCGKCRKDRMVPLGQRSAFWLARYIEEARPTLLRGRATSALFVGARGGPLSLPWMSTVVSAYVRSALHGRRGSCHALRHAMATLMLEGGADIRYIQRMLGHAQLSTTQVYTHVLMTALQSVHATCHPCAKLEGSPEPRAGG
jgi:integrase/recombinase XerD